MIFRSLAVKLFVLGFLVAAAASAQTSGGMFRGEVRDASNGVVAGARIVIQSNENGMEAVAESNSDGLYIEARLPWRNNNPAAAESL